MPLELDEMRPACRQVVIVLLLILAPLAGCVNEGRVNLPFGNELTTFTVPPLRLGFVADYAGNGTPRDTVVGSFITLNESGPGNVGYTVQPGHLLRVASSTTTSTFADSHGESRRVFLLSATDVGPSRNLLLGTETLDATTLEPLDVTQAGTYASGSTTYSNRAWSSAGRGIFLDLSLFSNVSLSPGHSVEVTIGQVPDDPIDSFHLSLRFSEAVGLNGTIVMIGSERSTPTLRAFEYAFRAGTPVPIERTSRFTDGRGATLHLVSFTQGSGPPLPRAPSTTVPTRADDRPWNENIPPEGQNNYLPLTLEEAVAYARAHLTAFANFLQAHPEAQAYWAQYDTVCQNPPVPQASSLPGSSCVQWQVAFTSRGDSDRFSVVTKRAFVTNDATHRALNFTNSSAATPPGDPEGIKGNPSATYYQATGPPDVVPTSSLLTLASKIVRAQPRIVFYHMLPYELLDVDFSTPEEDGSSFFAGLVPTLEISAVHGVALTYFGPETILKE